jgi:hypothetical protein
LSLFEKTRSRYNNITSKNWALKLRMYTVKSKTKQIEAINLDEAMRLAKEMNELVTIEGHGIEIIGLFGAASVLDGKCPDGTAYTWKKRRR